MEKTKKVCTLKASISFALVLCVLFSSLVITGSVNTASAADIKDDAVVAEAPQTSLESDYHCCSYYLNTEDSGHRMYSEWASWLKTAGVSRQTKISVYLKAGETAYFGSSVYDSRLRADGHIYNKKGVRYQFRDSGHKNENQTSYQARILKEGIEDSSNCDIVVETPNGEIMTFDVQENGAGHIYTRAQEKNGADYLNEGNENQYIPLSFNAEVEGTYEFHFHSKYGTCTDPTPVVAKLDAADIGLLDGNNENSAYLNAAFWDVTVVDHHSLASDGTTNTERKKGRVYTKYLSMINGANPKYSNISIYVLTTDGVKYQVKMEKINPFGFIFFANNRGLYTNDNSMNSIYHSVYAGDNYMDYLNPKEQGCNVTFNSPMTNDTVLNRTYNLFFENPSDDLEHILFEKPSMPSIDPDIKFIGYEGNRAYYTKGGYFKIKVENASSVTIAIDFTNAIAQNYEKACTVPDTPETPEEEMLRQQTKTSIEQYYAQNGNCKIELSGPVFDGENTFFWNGKDTNDVYVPVGEYSKELIFYQLIPKIGEVHFPMLDVEGCGQLSNNKMKGGFSIHRITDIVNEDGESVVSSDADALYYNNNPLGYYTINGEDEEPVIDEVNTTELETWYILGDGSKTHDGQVDRKSATTTPADISRNLFKSNGEPYAPLANLPDLSGNTTASNNVMAFNQKGGDTSAVDTWTYCLVSDTIENFASTDFIIEEENDFHGTLKGKLFFDTNHDGYYMKDMSADFPLSGYTMIATCVESLGEEAVVGKTYITDTDADGIFTFASLPKGKYTVDLYEENVSDYQRTAFSCTTNNSMVINEYGGDHPSESLPVYTIDEEHCIEENNYIIDADDIGMYVETGQYSYTIHKIWGESVSNPTNAIIAKLYAAKKGEDGRIEDVGWVKTMKLTASSNWDYTVNYLSSKYLYYVVESYIDSDGNEIIIGGSDPVAPELNRTEPQFDGITGTIVTPQTEGSVYNANFEYSMKGANGRLINITNATNSYKVYFHMNLTNDESDCFRVYYPRNDAYNYTDTETSPSDNTVSTQDGQHWLTDDLKIDDFYDIPTKELNPVMDPDILGAKTKGKVFLGWYYDQNYNATTRPVKWNTDTYTKTEHIYAHWFEVGTVQKDKNDEKETETDEYVGFKLFGTQIRNHIYDSNYDDGDPYYTDYVKQTIGLRFVASIRNDMLGVVNELYKDGVYDRTDDEYKSGYYSVTADSFVDSDIKAQNLSYGFAVAKESNADRYIKYYTDKGKKYDTLEYMSANTNGVKTTKTYEYVTNFECTSNDYNKQTNIVDHRNYDDYRIMSFVLTFVKGDVEANKATNYIVRPYLRYIDSNGLVRTFYDNYDGNSKKLCGCCTSFNTINNMFKKLVEVYTPGAVKEED